MKNYRFFTKCVVCAIVVQMTFFSMHAQKCADAYITATTSPATCPGNGQIHITFYGDDLLLDGIDSALQPKLWLTPTTPGGTIAGDVSLSGSGYNRIYPGVAAGSYIVEVRAFCRDGDEWMIGVMTTTVTVANGYANLQFSASQARKTLNCRPTGQIGMNISSGSLPYEITITGDNLPAGYPATKYPTAGASTFDDLPAGNYTVTAKDGCNTTSVYNVTVQALAQDMPFSGYSSQLSRVGNTLDCTSVFPYTLGINKAGVDWDYYWANFPLFYEYAYTVNNNMADTVWKPYPSPSVSVGPTFQLPLPYSEFCAGGNTVQIKFRVIGCPTIYSYNLNTTSYICNKSPWVQNNTTATIDHEGSCTQAKFNLTLYSSWGVCYPAEWRITPTADPTHIIKSGTLDGMGANPAISTAATSAIYERGSEYTVTLTGSDGQIYTFFWKPPLGGQAFSQNIFTETTGSPCLGYQWRFETSGTFNAGTRFEYLSGPMELPFGPVGTVKIVDETYNSNYYIVTAPIYVMMEAGTYSFKITNTCGRDTIMNRTFTGYSSDPFTYDVGEQFCNKMRIYPQGRIKSTIINGSMVIISNYTTYYYILEGPPGTNYGPSSPRVAPGGYLELIEPGIYTIAMSTASVYGCVFTTMEVEYLREDLTLDPSGTIAYLCKGASHGHIFVKGMNGTPPYTFTVTAPKKVGADEIIDTWTITSDANGNGAFYDTGLLGETYMITIADGCRTAEVPITVQAIENANIAYMVPSSGIFCEGEEMNINCIALGNTTYSWTGPCSFASTAQRPRPVAAFSPCNTGYTKQIGERYQVTVKPEGCAEVEVRNLSPTVISAAMDAPVITGEPVVCVYPDIDWTEFVVHPPLGAMSYRWTFPPDWSPSTIELTKFEDTIVHVRPPADTITGAIVAVEAFNDCGGSAVGYFTVDAVQNLPPLLPSTQTTCNGKIKFVADLTVTGMNIKWYDENYDEITSPTTTPVEDETTYYATQSAGECQSDYAAVFVTAECYSSKGTIFPFVHTDDETFDAAFAATAKLYMPPPPMTLDKIGFIRKQTPLHTTPVRYYDCDTDDVIVGAPKHPGTMGNFDNPGLPIDWSMIGQTSGVQDRATLTPADRCPTAPIGWFLFEEVAPGDYVLELSRNGFLSRYGVVHIANDNYLGHRELLGGDVNGDMKIDEKDYSAIRSKESTHGNANYEIIYDVTGDKGINSADINVIRVNFGAHNTIYQETEKWVNP
ncbi:MAG: hypothetical protein FWG84_08090 [Bacteroidales bacterium]|nr:hypothetical protein [Bacteroidales bacterium]